METIREQMGELDGFRTLRLRLIEVGEQLRCALAERDQARAAAKTLREEVERLQALARRAVAP